ncbi:MAG: hypothetical protein JSW27_24515 [Phycisphaerales bacterium]|nr:MAG: hypothetical protein JSW27_24515 [Phycisphaerales bacterium]
MRTFKVIIVLAALALTGALTSSPAWAQEASETPPPGAPPVEMVKADGDVRIKLNFQETPLQAVLEYLSETAGLTVISDQPLMDGSMTVISRQPISLNEAVSLINSMLKEKGLTTVLRGKTLKVVTLEQAKLENLPVLTGRDPDAIVAGDDVVTYVVPVGHVSAQALQANLMALVPEYASLEANEDGNALIITDTTANIKRLVQIVRALDTHMSMVAEIRVFRLTSADATSAATLINNIFEQDQAGTSGRQGPRNPMEMMMQRFGRGRGGRGGPGDGDDNGGAQAGGSANVKIVAVADERTNSVVVRGPGEAMPLVEDLIKSLDDTTVEVAGVRVFQLRYADATNVADVINTLFGEEQASSQNDRGGPMMFRGPFGRGGPGGGQDNQQDDTNSKLQIRAAADSQTNTVVVTGPDKMLEIVTQVVEKLDTQLPNVADVKVFHLEYADAQDTAELINEVFGESSTSSSSRNSRNQQNQQIRFMRGGPPIMDVTSTNGGGGSDITVVAAADSLTNSVVVSGPPETLKIIADVIEELDENPEQERQIFVYPLENADATNLMEILNNLFEELQALNQQGTGTTGQQFQGGQRGAQPGGAAGGTASQVSGGANDLDEETYFEADTDTNSLLVLTSTKNYERIKPIIDELDKPVGQVLIKVLFAELSHSNSVDLGTEFSMLNLRSDGDFTESITSFGSPLSGLSVQTVEGDLDVTISALQEVGRLNVLSRPYILTRNNQMAVITVGEEVPIPTGSSQGTATTTTTFDYRDDIGIVLSVTPSINQLGLVNMVVTPQITTRTGETVQISEDLFPEVFATRSADTRVTVRNGQTIVIGGLIEDQITDTIRKVPLLGDIPIAGHLFKRTIKEKSKTELLIFLTPHVAQDSSELTPIYETERERSNLESDEKTAEIFRKHMEGMQGPDTKTPEPNEP